MTGTAFRKVERPARFLRFLVENALAGQAHILKESVLAEEVFERGAEWDSRTDPIVRQEAARLRKRLARHYEEEGARDAVRILLLPGSYVPSFLTAEHDRAASLVVIPTADPASRRVDNPPVPTQTPEPAAVEQREEVPVHRATPAWRWAGAACIVIASLAAFFYWPVKPPRSVAVLPLANLSADPANQYFGDGLTDEITDQLSRIGGLKVIARSSAFQFRGKAVDVREIGRKLNVANVLEGSVERVQGRVKVIVHLERASDGMQLWSSTYERSESGAFALQSDIASDIAASLKLAASPAPPSHVPTPEAHDLALKGAYDLQQGTTSSVTQAQADFQRAIDIDPKYGAAYNGLATAIVNQTVARGSSFTTESERNAVRVLYQKAVELDPALSSAHAGLGGIAMQQDWDWAEAEREAQLALAGPPNAGAENLYAFLLLFRGRIPEADEHLRRMIDINPFSTAAMLNLALARNIEGRYAESREICGKVVALYPKVIGAHSIIAQTYVEEGRLAEAKRELDTLRALGFAGLPMYEAMARAKAGQREEALRLIRPFEDKYPAPGVAMQWFALVYALLGDEPNTLKWLNRSADRHEFQALNIGVLPVYAGMRNSAGFRALRTRLGLP